MHDSISTVDSRARKNMPTSLFRYRPPNMNTICEICRSEIHFSKPSRFNDPFDCCHSIEEATRKERERLMEKGFDDQIILDSVFADINFILMGQQLEWKDNVGLCCFSEKPYSISMWTHYAEDHNGVCIEYDVDSLLKCGIKLGKVLYSEDMLVRPYSNGRKPSAKDILVSFFNKSIEFDKENEWRAIRLDNPVEENVPVPGSIKSVTIGCNAIGLKNRNTNRFSIIREIIRICKSNNIPVKVAIQSFDHYALNDDPEYTDILLHQIMKDY